MSGALQVGTDATLVQSQHLGGEGQQLQTKMTRASSFVETSPYLNTCAFIFILSRSCKVLREKHNVIPLILTIF